MITLAAISLSLGSLVLLLGNDQRSGWLLVPAVANVPLGWATLHTIMAFHYAHLFFTKSDEGDKRRDSGGLEFPKTKEPCFGDFLYFSFVVGMTAQTSDVDLTSRAMRNTTVVHGAAREIDIRSLRRHADHEGEIEKVAEAGLFCLREFEPA